MAPEILRNNKACNDAMALIDARGDTLWAVEVSGQKIRLIVADPKKVACNEEFKKLVIALEELKKKCSTFNDVRDLMQIDIDTKAEIIQSLEKEAAESQPLKEENTKLRLENAKLLSEASGASLIHAAEIQTLNEQLKEKDATHEAATQSFNDRLQKEKADYSELQEELRKSQDMNAVQAAIIENMQAKEEFCMQEEKVCIQNEKQTLSPIPQPTILEPIPQPTILENPHQKDMNVNTQEKNEEEIVRLRELNSMQSEDFREKVQEKQSLLQEHEDNSKKLRIDGIQAAPACLDEERRAEFQSLSRAELQAQKDFKIEMESEFKHMRKLVDSMCLKIAPETQSKKKCNWDHESQYASSEIQIVNGRKKEAAKKPFLKERKSF